MNCGRTLAVLVFMRAEVDVLPPWCPLAEELIGGYRDRGGDFGDILKEKLDFRQQKSNVTNVSTSTSAQQA
jgi:hypothetical protein